MKFVIRFYENVREIDLLTENPGGEFSDNMKDLFDAECSPEEAADLIETRMDLAGYRRKRNFLHVV